ncbi:MAG: TrmH family RNA methyltransferase [Bacilli bacterium]
MKRIESTQNDAVKRWKKLLQRKHRYAARQFLVEGVHLVEEAARAGVIEQLIVVEGTQLPKAAGEVNALTYEITAAVAKEIQETETTQGIFAVCSMQFGEDVPSDVERVLLIDAVQDPGNVGTMIRTANAAGVDTVVLGKGSVDPYNAKTVRATQGAIFHTRIVQTELSEAMLELRNCNIPIYGTAIQDAVPYNTIQVRQSFALIMGNEGSGVNPSLLQQTDENVSIPIFGEAESLNVAVATGILLYDWRMRSE